MCANNFLLELDLETKTWICATVTKENKHKLKCAPGEKNIGKLKNTCLQCNTDRDYWPKTSVHIDNEFDQTCEFKATQISLDIAQFDYKHFIRIRGIYFILAGLLIIGFNLLLIKVCM